VTRETVEPEEELRRARALRFDPYDPVLHADPYVLAALEDPATWCRQS
jgi:hypothetical protein